MGNSYAWIFASFQNSQQKKSFCFCFCFLKKKTDEIIKEKKKRGGDRKRLDKKKPMMSLQSYEARIQQTKLHNESAIRAFNNNLSENMRYFKNEMTNLLTVIQRAQNCITCENRNALINKYVREVKKINDQFALLLSDQISIGNMNSLVLDLSKKHTETAYSLDLLLRRIQEAAPNADLTTNLEHFRNMITYSNTSQAINVVVVDPRLVESSISSFETQPAVIHTVSQTPVVQPNRNLANIIRNSQTLKPIPKKLKETAPPEESPIVEEKALGAPDAPPLGAPDAPPLGAPDAPPLVVPDAPPLVVPDAPPLVVPDAPPFGAPDAPPLGAPDAPPLGAPDAPPLGAPPIILSEGPRERGKPTAEILDAQKQVTEAEKLAASELVRYTEAKKAYDEAKTKVDTIRNDIEVKESINATTAIDIANAKGKLELAKTKATVIDTKLTEAKNQLELEKQRKVTLESELKQKSDEVDEERKKRDEKALIAQQTARILDQYETKLSNENLDITFAQQLLDAKKTQIDNADTELKQASVNFQQTVQEAKNLNGELSQLQTEIATINATIATGVDLNDSLSRSESQKTAIETKLANLQIKYQEEQKIGREKQQLLTQYQSEYQSLENELNRKKINGNFWETQVQNATLTNDTAQQSLHDQQSLLDAKTREQKTKQEELEANRVNIDSGTNEITSVESEKKQNEEEKKTLTEQSSIVVAPIDKAALTTLETDLTAKTEALETQKTKVETANQEIINTLRKLADVIVASPSANPTPSSVPITTNPITTNPITNPISKVGGSSVPAAAAKPKTEAPKTEAPPKMQTNPKPQSGNQRSDMLSMIRESAKQKLLASEKCLARFPDNLDLQARCKQDQCDREGKETSEECTKLDVDFQAWKNFDCSNYEPQACEKRDCATVTGCQKSLQNHQFMNEKRPYYFSKDDPPNVGKFRPTTSQSLQKLFTEEQQMRTIKNYAELGKYVEKLYELLQAFNAEYPKDGRSKDATLIFNGLRERYDMLITSIGQSCGLMDDKQKCVTDFRNTYCPNGCADLQPIQIEKPDDKKKK